MDRGMKPIAEHRAGGGTMRGVRGTFVAGTLAVGLSAVAASASATQELSPRDELFAHSEEFRQEVIEVTEGIYVAVGYALGNAILVEGEDGVLIIDTTGRNAARAIKAEFDRITTDPVRAIIYTHSHGDHTQGASVFAGDAEPEVYAHESFLRENRPTPVGRSGREGGNQSGGELPAELRPNRGIGPGGGGGGGGSGYMEPTVTFSGERYAFEVAGINVELVYAPGETNDQIYVWLPDRQVLFPGDNFYRAFPNVYGIRGVPLRRVDHWVQSLAKMVEEDPAYLVPSHGRPIIGRDNVRAALRPYHDGVESVLDQTIAGMNQGLRPDELAEAVRLPEDLAQHPWLREFYGSVEWSVRAIYSFYLGWFDGNASNLFPLSNAERARRILELAGGVDALLVQGRDAMASDDHQWAAEAADYVLHVEPENVDAMLIKAEALEALAEQQINAGARNWYLTSAQWLRTRAAR